MYEDCWSQNRVFRILYANVGSIRDGVAPDKGYSACEMGFIRTGIDSIIIRRTGKAPLSCYLFSTS